MLRGYRGIIVAALGWIALCAAQQPSQGTKSASQQEQPISEGKGAALPSESYGPYRDRYADACYYAKSHDSADLCAQWRAAIAAEKAAGEARFATIAAIVGTILSLVTVIGLIITIWQTNGALGEARRGNRLNLLFERRSRRESREASAGQSRTLEIAAANAAAAHRASMASAESNRIAQEAISLQRQNAILDHRPWLSVDVKKLYDIFFDDAGNLRLTYAINVKNSGKTPAVVTTACVMFTDKDEKGMLNFSKFISQACESLEFRSSAIAPGNQEVFMSFDYLIGIPPVYPNKSVPQLFVGVIYQGIESSGIYYSVHQVSIDMRNIGKDVKSSPPYFMLKSFMT